MIVERASAGNDDHVEAALTLFLDFLNIFIHILIILVRCTHKTHLMTFCLHSQTDKKEKEEEKRRKSK